MQHNSATPTTIEQHHCMDHWNQQNGCCMACLKIPSIVAPGPLEVAPKPDIMTSFYGAMALDDHDLSNVEGYVAGSLIPDVIEPDPSPRQDDTINPRQTLISWEPSTSADRVSLDTIGIYTQPFGAIDPFLQYEPSNRYDSMRLRGSTEDVDVLRGIGEHSTPLGDANMPLHDDEGDFGPVCDMEQLPHRPPQQPFSRNNLAQSSHFISSDSNIFASSELVSQGLGSTNPWAPYAIANHVGITPSRRGYYETSDSQFSANDAVWSPPECSPVGMSETSSHPYFLPVLSDTEGTQRRTTHAEQDPESRVTREHQHSTMMRMERQGVADWSHRSRLNACFNYTAVGGGGRALSVRSSPSNHLAVPNSTARRRRGSSPAPSESSVTPSDVEAVMSCKIAGCPAEFTGVYGRGNLRRHLRLFHTEARFPCGVRGCGRIFNRQDARLKHYRKQHADDLPSLPPLLTRRNHGVG